MNNLWISVLGLSLTSSLITGFINSAIANVNPDNTLPQNSQVTEQGTTININGGTRPTNSNNLFHSFQEFSIPADYTAIFVNQDNVQNIITRVTGNSVSQIDGMLKVNGSNTNLFFINPNGIIFGPNAALDIGGSFIASTANSINFQDGTQFIAKNPPSAPLLSVSVPVGLQFGTTAASIENQSQAEPTNIFNSNSGLRVQAGKTIALVGGDITLKGGNLTARSGRIELGSVGPNSLVSLDSENGWSLGFKGTQIFQDIRLMSRGNNNEIYSVIDTTSSRSNPSGTIKLQGNLIEINGDSTLVRSINRSNMEGGNITINARKLSVRDGSQVTTSTQNNGASGNLIVNSLESVELIGGSSLVETGLITRTAAAGSAGDIYIKTPTLRIKDGARVATGAEVSEPRPSLPESAGGNIEVEADTIEITGTLKNNNSVFSELSASTFNYGNAGKIDIKTKQLIVRDQGRITVEFQSNADTIAEIDLSQVGTPGELNINARSIMLNNQGQITASSGIGQGGNINLNVQDSLQIRGGSQISASAGINGGDGNGGNLSINSPKIFLQNGSSLSAEANSGDGGNISLEIQDLLLMQGGSQITTSAGGDGNGGNITINAPNGFIVATPLGNNDITANANSGSGGKITINAQRILGLVPRTRTELAELLNTENPNPQDLPTSDITAISQQNPSLNGIVQINTPDVDPSKGLTELDEETVDTSQQIDRGCGVSGRSARGSFSVVGKGGLAANPNEFLSNDGTLTNWISLEENSSNIVSSVQPQTKDLGSSSVDNPPSIVEAQGWVIDANGKVSLVANTPNSPAFASASCTTP